MQAKHQSLTIYALIVVSALFYFYKSLFYGFSQDDFIHLSAARVNSFGEVVNFFNPFAKYPDIFFYRPLSTQFFYFLMNSIFGLQAFYYHLAQIIFHILNGIVFYLLVKRIWKDKLIAILVAFMFTISSVHFLSLFYIGAFQQLLKTFLVFLTMLFYLNFLEKNQLKWLIVSLITFILSLLSKEGALTTPLLLLALQFWHDKKIHVIKMGLFFGILFLYLLVRFAGIQSIFSEGDYQYSFSLLNIFQNLKWYFLWTFGLPEIITTYPSLSLSSAIQFAKDYSFGVIVLISFVIFIFLSLVSFRKITTLPKKLLLFSIAIFIIPLLPVIILQNHKYPHYLDVSLLGILPLILFLLIKTFNQKVVYFVFLLSFALLQFFSIQISEQTHWTTHRAIVADFYHQELLLHSDILSKQAIIFVGPENKAKEVSFALASGYAINVWFPDSKKKVLFTHQIPTPTDPKTLLIPITIY